MRMAIAGLGGIGSHFADRLTDFIVKNQVIGVTEITYIDPDVFAEKNEWIQKLGPLALEGRFQPKAVVLAAIHQTKCQRRITIRGNQAKATATDILMNDIFVCCVDNSDFRREMFETVFNADTKAGGQLGYYDDNGTKINPWWLDLRVTGKLAVAWVRSPNNTKEKMLATLPKKSVTAGCQTVADELAETYQNGSPFIANWGLQVLLQHLRGESYPDEFVYNFDA